MDCGTKYTTYPKNSAKVNNLAIHFITSRPAALLKAFDERIAQEEPEGKITTWRKTPNGNYTHIAKDWKDKAFFRSKIEEGQLSFSIFPANGETVTTPVYGYYHGHLIETFLNHFDEDFDEVSATARLRDGDIASKKKG